jgi:hypothetical protein
VVRIVWSDEPETYASGSIATGRGSHAGQVKGDDPDKKGYPGPPGWGLGWQSHPLQPCFRTQFRDLQPLIHERYPVILCFKRPSSVKTWKHELIIPGYKAHRYVHPGSKGIVKATLLREWISFVAIQIQTTLQVAAVRIHLPSTFFSISLRNIYLLHANLISEPDFSHLLSQLPAPLIFLEILTKKKHVVTII